VPSLGSPRAISQFSKDRNATAQAIDRQAQSVAAIKLGAAFVGG